MGIAPQLTPPAGLVDLVLALGYEVLIGVFIGGVARMLMSAMGLQRFQALGLGFKVFRVGDVFSVHCSSSWSLVEDCRACGWQTPKFLDIMPATTAVAIPCL